MNANLLEAAPGGPVEQTSEVVDMAVDATIGTKADQVECLAAGHQAVGQGIELRVVVDAAVAHGLRDPHQLLADHTSSADGEVPDLGVAHLAVG